MNFAHIATLSRPGVETQWSEIETKARRLGSETETRPRLQKPCLEISTFHAYHCRFNVYPEQEINPDLKLVIASYNFYRYRD